MGAAPLEVKPSDVQIPLFEEARARRWTSGRAEPMLGGRPKTMRGMIYMLSGQGRAILRIDFDYSDNDALEDFRAWLVDWVDRFPPATGIEITSKELWPLRPLKT